MQEIDNIELTYLEMENYEELKNAMIESYHMMEIPIGIKIKFKDSLQSFLQTR